MLTLRQCAFFIFLSRKTDREFYDSSYRRGNPTFMAALGFMSIWRAQPPSEVAVLANTHIHHPPLSSAGLWRSLDNPPQPSNTHAPSTSQMPHHPSCVGCRKGTSHPFRALPLPGDGLSPTAASPAALGSCRVLGGTEAASIGNRLL